MEKSSCICMPIAYIEMNCRGHVRHVNWHAVKRDFDQTLHAIVWKKKKAQTKCLITPSFTRALTEGTQTKGSRCWVGGVGVWESSHLSENPSQESRPFWAETETKNSGCIWPKTKTENAFYFTYIFILYNCINIRRFNEIE